MPVQPQPRWESLDAATRHELDEQYLEELARVAEPGLSDEAIEAYLAYRHERPLAQITTFETGQIRHMLHGLRDPARIPDPVEREEHRGRIERFGANKLHLTNFGTFVFVIAVHIYAGVLAILLFLILRS